ncbi:hypothetical protein PENCOP_c013G04494 [Penicillium coprophilum]|uniref:Uncharacterized protein n=1 Tax=Penicillium coprophilum TaxID=36646 RepID=A0A1V6UBX5_9EURO|nr:hypothetical protein PENCOP_c013G04494 [Penicillium coprophilum]
MRISLPDKFGLIDLEALLTIHLENARDWDLGDWEREINLAREAHIDGFALNFGSGVDYNLAFLKAFVTADTLSSKLFSPSTMPATVPLSRMI